VYVGLYGRIFSTLIVVSFRVVRDVGSCGGMIFREPSPAALRAAILGSEPKGRLSPAKGRGVRGSALRALGGSRWVMLAGMGRL